MDKKIVSNLPLESDQEELNVQSIHKKEFKIPKLITIFSFGKNPLPVDEEWLDLSYDYSCMDEKYFKKIRSTSVTAGRFHPFCNDVNRFGNLVKFWQLYGIMDDHSECKWGDVARKGLNAQEIWGQALACVDRLLNEDYSVSLNKMRPYVVYWFTVFEDMCKNMKRTGSRRLLKEFRSYILGNIEEAQKFGHGFQFDTIDEFKQMRARSSGVFPTFALILYADNVNLTDEQYESPLFQDFLFKAGMVVCYHNDICSFEKEYLEQGKQLSRMCNVVAWTAILEQISIEEAIESVCGDYPQVEREAKESIDKLLEFDKSEDIKIFCNRMTYIMSGNFFVDTTNDRYNKLY